MCSFIKNNKNKEKFSRTVGLRTLYRWGKWATAKNKSLVTVWQASSSVQSEKLNL